MSSQCWTSSIYQPVQYQFLSLLWLWVSLVTKINPPNHGGDPFISVGSAGMAHLSTTSTTSSTPTAEMQENLRISTLYNAGLRWYHSNHDPGMDWVWFKNFRALDIWNLDLLRQIWCTVHYKSNLHAGMVANSWFFGLGKKDQIALRIVILAFCSFRWKINRETHRFDMGCAGLKQSYAGSCVWWYDLQSVSSSLWIENLDTILWTSISLLSLSSWTSTQCIVVAVARKQKSPRKRHPWLGCGLGAWQSW